MATKVKELIDRAKEDCVPGTLPSMAVAFELDAHERECLAVYVATAMARIRAFDPRLGGAELSMVEVEAVLSLGIAFGYGYALKMFAGEAKA